MENKNTTIIIGLLALIAGLIIGYGFGFGRGPMGYGMFGFGGHMFGDDYIYEEMEEHMYGDDEMFNDGFMRHAMDEMMLGFRGLSGEEYEEAFLKGMIVHHLGAINMAEELLEQTNRPELVELANNIIESQSEEVDMMKEWLNDWFKN